MNSYYQNKFSNMNKNNHKYHYFSDVDNVLSPVALVTENDDFTLIESFLNASFKSLALTANTRLIAGKSPRRIKDVRDNEGKTTVSREQVLMLL